MAKTFYLVLLVLFVLIPTSLQLNNLPWRVTNKMASRNIRYHHFVWHNIRNLWNNLNSTVQAQIASYGWAPPRPAQDKNGNALTDNNSGQDFLYFHRQMINVVNKLLKKYGYKNVSGFTTIPAANSTKYPLQPVYTAPTTQLTKLVKYYKSDTYYNILKEQERKLTDPDFLRNMTLGQLGSYIEFVTDVHQGLHFRYSENATIYRPRSSMVVPSVDPKYDVNTSDWMGDIYCSQVNPWFWKLHGWIDNKINDWQKAHNLTKIHWVGNWTGGSMSSFSKNFSIPNDPDVRFLGKKDDVNTDNNMKNMDQNNKVNGTSSCDEEDSDMDFMNDMGGDMNMTKLQEVAKIIIGTGLHSDYFSDLDRRVVPEHWDDDGDNEDGTCNKQQKL